MDALRSWHKTTESVLSQVGEFEAKKLDVGGAAEMRKRFKESQNILTPDEKFFADDKLVALRDEALDSHARGAPLEHGAG